MKTSHKAAAGSIGAGAIAICCTFTPQWEGLWTTAQVDTIGTGHPVTYCYGQTSEFGDVRAGQKFTPEQCKEKLAESLPTYLAKIAPCIKVNLPDKVTASLLDAAYNAGPAAVCKSPMLAKMNAGDLEGGCKAFDGWYVHASGRVVQGLINRRSGDSKRMGEKELCLEGLNEPKTQPQTTESLWTKILNFLKGNFFHVRND